MKIPFIKRQPADPPMPQANNLILGTPEKKSDLWREAGVTAALFVAAILIALCVKTFMIQPYVVDGQSMETTLQNQDRLLVNKLPLTLAHIGGHSYIPRRGDIIIFNQSNLPGYIGTKQLIKRVIGLPGERVVVNEGKVMVLNKNFPNGFNPDTTGNYRLSVSSTTGDVDVTLGPNELFVCGDNRPNSEDSRAFGPITKSQVVGKLSFRVFPLSKLHHY